MAHEETDRRPYDFPRARTRFGIRPGRCRRRISRRAGQGRVAEEKQTALDWLSRPETVAAFGKISDAIWEYAELGLQESRSSKLLADTLEEAGFTVERGLAGMPTCFVGTYGSGKPVIGLLGEFDALPMLSQKANVPTQDPIVPGAPGHGCGHNAMATAAVSAAIAVKEAMDKYHLPGTIKVFGSPAEEIVASRPYMVRAGLFKDIDAVIDNHSGERLRPRVTAGEAMPCSPPSSPSRVKRPTPPPPGPVAAPWTPLKS